MRLSTHHGLGQPRLLVAFYFSFQIDISLLLERQLELWGEVKWQAQIAQTIAFPGGLPPELEGFSL